MFHLSENLFSFQERLNKHNTFWFYQKGMANGQPELALMCSEARTGADAKYIAKGIKCAKDWDTSVFAQNLMRDIQLARYDQVDAVADAMQEAHMAGTYMVVKDTFDLIQFS